MRNEKTVRLILFLDRSKMETESSLSIAGFMGSVILFVILVLPPFLLSKLTKIEHDDYHDQWERDGKPHGLPFWVPKNERSVLGFRSYPGFVGIWWLFKTPEWTIGHKTAAKLLRYYRIISYVICIGMMGICLTLMLSAPK
jgi:hypothetical protein